MLYIELNIHDVIMLGYLVNEIKLSKHYFVSKVIHCSLCHYFVEICIASMESCFTGVCTVVELNSSGRIVFLLMNVCAVLFIPFMYH